MARNNSSGRKIAQEVHPQALQFRIFNGWLRLDLQLQGTSRKLGRRKITSHPTPQARRKNSEKGSPNPSSDTHFALHEPAAI